MDDRINICYCADNKLFKQLLVSIVSLANTTFEALNVINLTVECPEVISTSKKTTPPPRCSFR